MRIQPPWKLKAPKEYKTIRPHADLCDTTFSIAEDPGLIKEVAKSLFTFVVSEG